MDNLGKLETGVQEFALVHLKVTHIALGAPDR